MSVQNKMFNPKRFHKSQMKFHLILFPIALFMISPIIFIINNAFKPYTELFQYPPKFFVRKPSLENFQMLWEYSVESGIPLTRYLFNSIIVALLVVFFSVFISAMTAYALSKLKMKGKDTIMKINNLALMFVPVAVAIPRFLIILKLGVFNSLWAHILPLLAMPVGLFLVKQFVDQVPDEYIEAAKIDGATNWYIFRKIIIPLIKPSLVTVAVLAFQATWGNLESSNLFIDIESYKTLPYYLNTIVSSSGNVVASSGMGAVAQLIVFLPNFIIFIFLQNRVMESMAHSGIK